MPDVLIRVSWRRRDSRSRGLGSLYVVEDAETDDEFYEYGQFGRFKRMLWVTGMDLDIDTRTHVLLSVCTIDAKLGNTCSSLGMYYRCVSLLDCEVRT
jgi:hypothetical protein